VTIVARHQSAFSVIGQPPEVLEVHPAVADRLVARTLPAKQFEVGRELRGRIVEAFRAADISAPVPFVDGSASL
jgi:small conductance mechanosensitive channel